MYVEHMTDRYYTMLENGEANGYSGWLGAVLVQPGGSAKINEAMYYEGSNTFGKRARGYTSVYIKAAAISCGSCRTIQNYASFTCPMPPPATG